VGLARDNIEPTPGLIQIFELWRPEDINLAVAAGSESGAVAFHVFDEGGYNTLSAEIAGSRISSGKGAGHRVVEVPVRTLAEILANHLPEEKSVDLLTIDAEGHDLEVLRGMDWWRCKPGVILCENLGANNLSAPGGIPAVEFLQARGYRFFAATFNPLFFELESGWQGTRNFPADAH
jgi:FkbM family methyltransferase